MYNITKTVTISNAVKDDVSDCLEHDVVLPCKDLPSKRIKRFKDGKLIFNYYTDTNVEMKSKAEAILKKNMNYLTFKDFLSRLKTLSKRYRYFIQTDIIGAFYNFSFNDIAETLYYNVKDNELRKYIYGFYVYIRNTHEMNEYLYISDYSRYIFTLFLQRIFKNKNMISIVDDIILYGDDMDELKKMFKEFSVTLSEFRLYFNREKTFYLDTFYDSIYIFKTIVSVPACNILDNRVMDKIKDSIAKGEKIKVFELTDLIYNYIKVLKLERKEPRYKTNTLIGIEYHKNISLCKKLFYDMFEYFSVSKTVNNNLRYVPLEKVINTKKDIYYVEASECDDFYAYENDYEYEFDYPKY